MKKKNDFGLIHVLKIVDISSVKQNSSEKKNEEKNKKKIKWQMHIHLLK